MSHCINLPVPCQQDISNLQKQPSSVPTYQSTGAKTYSHTYTTKPLLLESIFSLPHPHNENQYPHPQPQNRQRPSGRGSSTPNKTDPIHIIFGNVPIQRG
ncbi:uncharacterized protein BDR25DRAFT_111794 [Lindgomyces ingoldianus]|uniref:Uncharacterized protein n=1 Tax=Lindgomyces ingoldianus TaxID=673940 RepID=A0ACB6R8G7_9PLEO|nr:uncharacterized protein BDR25DRAFT_111794 [Lindgomyces ingoldianus]KAF2474756.1 hypothetical protein BDR25DRAFT_111794 [Lindgomyces ingoldianus]